MITRGDVMASIQLAKLASRDSSSMKVVAVMTMAFLPATFFAALFSVPSLQWDSEEIVSSRFWIYWAFTLPCTALVFAAWLALTNRGGVRKALGAAWGEFAKRMA
jgi:Mg2+ and Co2+ transporter CorA